MTYVDIEKQPKAVSASDLETLHLLVKGQGIFIFSNQNSMEPATFSLYNQDPTDGLLIQFTPQQVSVKVAFNQKELIDPENSVGLINLEGAYYWFSIDYQNGLLYAGIGEARIEDVSYKFALETTSENRNFLESLYHIDIQTPSQINPLRIIRDPIRDKVPLKVIDREHITIEDLAANRFLPAPALSPVGQQLYYTISGPKFVLNTPDFPCFSAAIQRSIDTPGLWCYNKLREKSTEFNPNEPNLLETYLRITLDQNNGESPGIPNVIEIWPYLHYSPIHNHSSANAIIRVLSGEINVTLYPFLSDKIKPFGNTSFKKNEVTWISPTLNQVHMLKNIASDKKACITIQCYMYGKDDLIHYDYFDYVNSDGKIEQYLPDSDMDFLEFKALMKKEWNNRPKCKKPKCKKCKN